jgi:uncharacterized protein YndB with AHSA1/START domain
MTSKNPEPLARRVGAMTVTVISDLEFQLTRAFDAPRQLVFDAHSKCEHVRHWWGTRGHTMVACEIDFRPGGRWRFVLRKANGKEYAFRGEFQEIVAPERIVQTFEYEGDPGHVSIETLVFTEVQGRTTLTATERVSSIQARDAMLQGGMEQGAAETYDRLEEYLPSLGR